MIRLLALLAIALSLLSAGPADARHHGSTSAHHRGDLAQHSAMPMPRERPNTWKEVRPLEQRVRSNTGGFSPDEYRPQQAMSFAGAATTEARLIELGQQLVLIGMWRLQTDQFYRR